MATEQITTTRTYLPYPGPEPESRAEERPAVRYPAFDDLLAAYWRTHPDRQPQPDDDEDDGRATFIGGEVLPVPPALPPVLPGMVPALEPIIHQQLDALTWITSFVLEMQRQTIEVLTQYSEGRRV